MRNILLASSLRLLQTIKTSAKPTWQRPNLNANPAFGFAATFLTQFHPGKGNLSCTECIWCPSDVRCSLCSHFHRFRFASPRRCISFACSTFLFPSQHLTFAFPLLLSSLLRRRRRERSDALWSPLSSPFTKCIVNTFCREGKMKENMCNFVEQSTKTNKKRKSNFPLDGSADVGSAPKQWLGCPVQLFSATSGDHKGLDAWSLRYK